MVPKKVPVQKAMTNFSESFGYLTTGRNAIRWTQSMDLLQGQPGELYILDERIGITTATR